MSLFRKLSMLSSSVSSPRSLGRILLLALGLALPVRIDAGWVYQTEDEFLSSGDFDGDGRIDLAVVDRSTGNLRAGYQSTANALNWSPSRSTGIDHPSGFTLGRFIQLGRDAAAVTSVSANRIHLVSLSSATDPFAPLQRYSIGLGPNSMATLSAPFGFFPGSYDFLAVSSAEQDTSTGQRLDLMAAQAGDLSLGHSVTIPATLDRMNQFQFASNSASFLGGFLSSSNQDAFFLFQFTNTLLEPFVLQGLPSGSDWLFGRFTAGARILFYQPGMVSGLQVHTANPASPQVLVTPGTAITPFGSVVKRIELIARGNTNLLMVLFDEGQSAQLYDLAAGNTLIAKQSFTAPAGELFTSAISMASGQFAFLSGVAGERGSTKFHLYRDSGGTFSEVASGNLPVNTVAGSRATVLLFDQEPFVSRDPGFIGALAGGDWVTKISNLPAAITVVSESDRGPSAGLGASSTRSLGVAPSAARFGLPNQYHPAISFASLKSASGFESSSVSVTPPPGRYSGPIRLTLRSTAPADLLFVRRGNNEAWESYAGSVTLSNTTDLSFYAESPSTAARSRIQTALYEFPTVSQPFTPALGSNLPPISVAGSVQSLLITKSTKVFLDGTGSRDPEGGPLAYVWEQIKGPAVILLGGGTATPSFFTPVFSNTVVLQFRLTVFDDQQASAVSETAVVLDDGCVKPPQEVPKVGFNADGSFTGVLRWPGLPDQEVVVQASEDLETWVDLGTGTSDLLGLVIFTDLTAGNYEQRFYRAILK